MYKKLQIKWLEIITGRLLLALLTWSSDHKGHGEHVLISKDWALLESDICWGVAAKGQRKFRGEMEAPI